MRVNSARDQVLCALEKSGREPLDNSGARILASAAYSAITSDDLCDDLLRRIAGESSFASTDLACLRQVSRRWREAAASNGLPGNIDRTWQWWRMATRDPKSVRAHDIEAGWLASHKDICPTANIDTSSGALLSLYRAAGMRWPLAALESLNIAARRRPCGQGIALLQLSTRLRSLTVTDGLTAAGMKALTGLSQLTQLTLCSVRIRPRDAARIALMHNLRELSLIACRPGEAQVASIATMSGLSELTLASAAGLTPRQLASLSNMSSLHTLRLCWMDLDIDVTMAGLMRAGLRRLDLQGCLLAPDDAMALSHRLAPIEVTVDSA